MMADTIFVVTLKFASERDKDACLDFLEEAAMNGEIEEPFDTKVDEFPAGWDPNDR
jgi:hypothetical protein